MTTVHARPSTSYGLPRRCVQSRITYECSCACIIDQESGDDQAVTHLPLSSLYFCEDCDAIRCNECCFEEIASFYCPNCLFEVPQASVRAEKNRCTRNCFQCPSCDNTLTIAATDPAGEEAVFVPTSASASIGDPPYYLACPVCRWDSKTALGLIFQKPTGLAAQIQRSEETASAVVQYNAIREHVEAHLKRTATPASSELNLAGRVPTASIAAAARALASTSNQGLVSSSSSSKFGSLHNLAMSAQAAAEPRMKRINSKLLGYQEYPVENTNLSSSAKDVLKPFVPVATTLALQKQGVTERAGVEALSTIAKTEEQSSISTRVLSEGVSPLAYSLKPQRMPLEGKWTKRCCGCRQVLSKPDTKATSIKFKIARMASVYIPAIAIVPAQAGSVNPRLSAGGSLPSHLDKERHRAANSDIDEPLRPGRRYSYLVTFSNPLDQDIKMVVKMRQATSRVTSDFKASDTHANRRIHWRAVFGTDTSSCTFAVGPFAEEWEYDSLPFAAQTPQYEPGVVTKVGNKTTISMNLHLDREADGPIEAAIDVEFDYGVVIEDSKMATPSIETKTFAFTARIRVGTVEKRALHTVTSLPPR